MTTKYREKLHDYRVVFDVEGATAEDLAIGLEAAQAVFMDVGIDAWEGVVPFSLMDCGNNTPLTSREIINGLTYGLAIEAALKAACKNLPSTPKRYRFCVVQEGDVPVTADVDTVFPITLQGLLKGQTPTLDDTPKRKLKDGIWTWV